MDRQKILIADDEPGIRLLVSRMLGEEYVILEAADGEEALDIAERQQPALILMDLMMPKIDGYAACLRIKADQVTKEMGANGYITKPFTRKALLEEMRRLLPPA